MILSQRRLVFTSQCMYFQCRTTYFTEAQHWTSTVDRMSVDISLNPQAFPDVDARVDLNDLGPRLEEYYKRELSFRDDAIHAFAGVFDAFHAENTSEAGVAHFYGIPMFYNEEEVPRSALASFLHFLRWDIQPMTFELANQFPSWSWASQKASGNAGLLSCPRAWKNSRVCVGVDVQVWDNKGGVKSLGSSFTPNEDYLGYPPLLKITAWTKECSINGRDLARAHVVIFNRNIVVPDRNASDYATNILAVFLSVGFLHTDAEDRYLAGLVVTETRSGHFQRVCPFKCWFPSPESETSTLLGSLNDHDTLQSFLEHECTMRTIEMR